MGELSVAFTSELDDSTHGLASVYQNVPVVSIYKYQKSSKNLIEES